MPSRRTATGAMQRESDCRESGPSDRSCLDTWFGAAVVVAATAMVVALRNAAVPVLAIGLAASAVEISTTRLSTARRHRDARCADTRRPARDRSRTRHPRASVGPAGEGAVSSRRVRHRRSGGVGERDVQQPPCGVAARCEGAAPPLLALVGLDIGPNLFVTGSLSAFLWLRAAR